MGDPLKHAGGINSKALLEKLNVSDNITQQHVSVVGHLSSSSMSDTNKIRKTNERHLLAVTTEFHISKY